MDRPSIQSEDVVALENIATRLAVSVDHIRQVWIRHPTFPAPIVVLGSGAIYYWPDVTAWLLSFAP